MADHVLIDRAVVQQALEVLENAEDQLAKPYSTDASNAITALRAALAQAEPVQADEPLSMSMFASKADYERAQQQAEPVQRKPLTDEEMRELWSQYGYKSALCMRFARAIERAHGIKEKA